MASSASILRIRDTDHLCFLLESIEVVDSINIVNFLVKFSEQVEKRKDWRKTVYDFVQSAELDRLNRQAVETNIIFDRIARRFREKEDKMRQDVPELGFCKVTVPAGERHFCPCCTPELFDCEFQNQCKMWYEERHVNVDWFAEWMSEKGEELKKKMAERP